MSPELYYSIIVGCVTAVVTAIVKLVAQVRIGLRDRADRKALVKRPGGVAALTKIRVAQASPKTGLSSSPTMAANESE